MKRFLNHIWVGFLGLILFGCQGLDNYAEPKSMLTGKITYQGKPIGVERNQVWVQLWDPGLGKLASINTRIKQEGDYSELLFNRDYKLVFPAGRGPFKTIVKDATVRDTIYVKMDGNKTVDLEVLPYYLISNTAFTSGEKRVNATFNIDQIITGTDAREIERITLYVNKTQYVSGANNIASVNVPAAQLVAGNPINLTVNVPTMTPTQNYVYARVGLKIRGIEQLIFSEVSKVNI